jgi:hypothetical protein
MFDILWEWWYSLYRSNKNTTPNTEGRSMKIYKNESDTMRVGACERDGKYIIIIEKERKALVASRNSHKPHVEEYTAHYEKAFDTKEQANRYFLGIKKNNPTLKAI